LVSEADSRSVRSAPDHNLQPDKHTTSGGSAREALDGEHDQVWILDVEGKRIVIDAFDFVTTTPADRAELRSLIETVRISPN
jgi:hypothetical protein